MIRSDKDVIRDRLMLSARMDSEKADMLALVIAQDVGRHRGAAKVSLFLLFLVTTAIAFAANQIIGALVAVWWIATLFGLGR